MNELELNWNKASADAMNNVRRVMGAMPAGVYREMYEQIEVLNRAISKGLPGGARAVQIVADTVLSKMTASWLLHASPPVSATTAEAKVRAIAWAISEPLEEHRRAAIRAFLGCEEYFTEVLKDRAPPVDPSSELDTLDDLLGDVAAKPAGIDISTKGDGSWTVRRKA